MEHGVVERVRSDGGQMKLFVLQPEAQTGGIARCNRLCQPGRLDIDERSYRSRKTSERAVGGGASGWRANHGDHFAARPADHRLR